MTGSGSVEFFLCKVACIFTIDIGTGQSFTPLVDHRTERGVLREKAATEGGLR